MRIFITLLFLSLFAPLQSAAQAPVGGKPLASVNLITFGGGFNLPAWVAERQGFFAKHGVTVKLSFTPSSTFLMTNLLDGKYDFGIFGIDNLVAYQEGRGKGNSRARRTWLRSWG